MKVVLFDIDDTLLSFDETVKESLREGFKKYGLPKYEPYMYDVFKRENDKLWHRIELGTLDFETLKKIRFQYIFDALHIDFDGVTFEEYFREFLYDSAIVIDHVDEVLQYLKEKGYVLGVASNGPYNQQIHRLQISHLYDYFTYYFISEQIGYSKPSKEFFDSVLDTLQVKASDCVMVGDSNTSDIQGGKNAGMKTIYFGTKTSEADHTVQNLLQIKEIL